MLQDFGARRQRPPPAKKSKEKGAGKGGGNTWSWKSGSDVAAASGHGQGDEWTAWNTGASSSSSWNQNTSAGNEWSEWGARTWRSERSKSRAGSPYPGQYDHRGTDPAIKGTGMFAHDRRMKKYEDGAEDGDSDIPSENSERSD